MALKMQPPAPEFHAKHSQATRQLRLPLMAEAGVRGAVDELRVFLKCKSHAPAKVVAKAVGARPTRILNEDEDRALLSAHTIVFRYLDCSRRDRARFLNRLAALAGDPLYRKDLDDSAVGA